MTQSSNASKPLEIQVGFTGSIAIKVLPKTALKLESAGVLMLTQTKTALAIQGQCLNLPPDCPCELRWVVEREGLPAEEIEEDGILKTAAGGGWKACEVRLADGSQTAADAFRFGLFGRGALGLRVYPRFPHCDAGVLQAAWRFENIATAELEGLGDTRIGSAVRITPRVGRLFQEAALRLLIFESDQGEQYDGTAQEEYQQLLEWSAGDRSARLWRVGCHGGESDGEDESSGRAAALVYADPSEEGGYEFGYELQAAWDGGKSWKTLERKPTVLQVQSPMLKSFELVQEEKSLTQVFDWTYLSRQYENITRAQAEEIPVATLTVRGAIAGFAPGLRVPLKTSLWVQYADTFELFHNVHSWFDLDDDGAFEAKLYDLCDLLSDEWKRIREKKGVFRANLRLNPSASPLATKRPISAFIDYDEDKWTPFLQGAPSNKGEGDSVLSVGGDGESIQCRRICRK